MTSEPLETAEFVDEAVHEAAASAPMFGLPFLTRSRLNRLIKFGLVGVSGVVVNLAVFEVLYRLVDLRFALLSELALVSSLKIDLQFALANALGIVVSIFTNFLLNDTWTWGDRIKGSRRDWVGRLSKYYVSASAAAGVQLLVASGARAFVFGHIPIGLPFGGGDAAQSFDVGPTLAVLTGIAFGMAINFLASHLWAFRDAEVEE